MNNFAADPRVGVSVAGGTGLTGWLTKIGLTPELLGIVATMVGIIATLVIVVVNLQKMFSDSREARYRNEKNRLEIEQLKWKMEMDRKLAESKNDPAV